jgi:hypothetical protein
LKALRDDSSSGPLQDEHPVRQWLSEVKHAGCWYGVPAAVAALIGYPLYWAACSIAGRVSSEDSQDSHQYWENGGGD